MSIIEKAVDKLNPGDTRPRAAAVTPPPVREPPPIEAVEAELEREATYAARAAASAAVRSIELPPTVEAPRRSREVTLDLARLQSAGILTPADTTGQLAEECRLIKRPLLVNAFGDTPSPAPRRNLVMVTSSLPGEGKTFSAINLAISMAMELDYTVLLVDADVSRPSVFRQLGLPPERGLMDVLAGDVTDLSDVLLRTNIEKLSILPAGMPHQRATELLASENMNRLLKQIASRYSDRIVVFDSPPLLVTTESRVLATHMGQVVLVVESERTTHSSVKQALATIESCPIKLMMLNKSRHSGPGSYYGYGYGYGYGEKPRENAA